MNVSRTTIAFAFVMGALASNSMHAALGRTAAGKPSLLKISLGAGAIGAGSTIAALHHPTVLKQFGEKGAKKWQADRLWCPVVFTKECFTTKTQEQAPSSEQQASPVLSEDQTKEQLKNATK